MSVPDEDVTRLDVEGCVYHRLPESKAEEWRKAIRKVAREMGWTIRTGHGRDVDSVWAVRPDFQYEDSDVHGEFLARLLDPTNGGREIE